MLRDQKLAASSLREDSHHRNKSGFVDLGLLTVRATSARSVLVLARRPHVSERTRFGNLDGTIAALTGGRNYVFVVMSYNKRWNVFREVEQCVDRDCGLLCIRADHVKSSGHDLLAKIQHLIENAEVIIGEISDGSPNVYYEIGYAVALQKPILLLAEEGVDIPTDLRGFEVVRYRLQTLEDSLVLGAKIRDFVNQNIKVETPILRAMLQGETPLPCAIAISPRYPKRQRSAAGVPYPTNQYRTFGDYIGVVGLLRAFGMMFGHRGGVELLASQYNPGLELAPMNLYVIGSKKVNPLCGLLLDEIQNGKTPRWFLGAKHPEDEKGDYEVYLHRYGIGEVKTFERSFDPRDDLNRYAFQQDFGIVVRSPHPRFPDRLVLLMAGPRALGTAAACVAATNPEHIREIRRLLSERGVNMDNKRTPFWVLVSGKTDGSGMVDWSSVQIIEAGPYEPDTR